MHVWEESDELMAMLLPPVFQGNVAKGHNQWPRILSSLQTHVSFITEKYDGSNDILLVLQGALKNNIESIQHMH
jgi:hypothetical protein